MRKLLLPVLLALFFSFSLSTAAERGVNPRPVALTGKKVSGDQWLMVVGIDTYLHWPRLKTAVADAKGESRAYVEKDAIDVAADPVIKYMSREQIEKAIAKLEREMKAAVKELDFIEAARCRDEIFGLRKKMEEI